jgi:hypothetical protein
MARERLETFGDVRRHDKDPRYDRVRPQDVNPDNHVGPAPVHTVTGTGMDGLEVDLPRLAKAQEELAALHDDLLAHANLALDLTHPPRDGQSPIVAHMRRAFAERADVEGGVQKVLHDYLTELVNVRSAILATLGTYQALDAEAVAMLNRQTAELDAFAREVD